MEVRKSLDTRHILKAATAHALLSVLQSNCSTVNYRHFSRDLSGNMGVSSDCFDKAIDSSAKRFGFQLKKEQMLAIRNFMEGKDVFVSLPTGYGKILCYLLLPSIFNARYNENNSKIIVISPLISPMEDQVTSCKKSSCTDCR